MSADPASLPSIEVVRGTPTPEELGALIAVVGHAYEQEAAEATAEDDAATSRWASSRRMRRLPTRATRWGSFGS